MGANKNKHTTSLTATSIILRDVPVYVQMQVTGLNKSQKHRVNILVWCHPTDTRCLCKYHVFFFPLQGQWLRPVIPSIAETTLNHRGTAPVGAAFALERYTTLPSRGCVGLKMSIMGCPVQNRHCWTIASSWSGGKEKRITDQGPEGGIIQETERVWLKDLLVKKNGLGTRF